MKLHYNSDGSIRAIIKLNGQEIKMLFDTENDYKNFLKIIII